MTLRFRLAEKPDAELVQALLAQLAVHDGGVLRGGTDSLIRYGFGAQPMFRVTLALHGDEPVGLALFHPEYSSWRGQVGAYVQDLFVSKAARGAGLGRALLAEVFSASRDWDATFLSLMVQRSNPAAQQFYASAGFERRGNSDWLVLEGDNLAALVQHKARPAQSQKS